ncbi:MAG: hypothetical protein HPY57_13535 [Ignavibacteria bacterium]|nr:hypothetical protein [Ignavibacteria bacterium]
MPEYIAEHVDNNIAYSEYIAENVSDTQAYMNYIAEGLDNTIESIKSSKIFEAGNQMQIPNMRQVSDIDKYYDEDDDFIQKSQIQEPDETDDEPVQTQAQLKVQVQSQPKDQVQSQPKDQVQSQPKNQIQSQPKNQVQSQPKNQVQSQPNEIDSEMPDSIEGEPVGAQVQLVPGATVSIEDRTGEILASNPSTGILVVKMADNNELVEVHESKVNLIGDRIMETENSLKSYIGNLITETKKRKASENQEPHFVQFLTEKNKKAWYGLTSEDKEKVIFTINESKEPIYTENQVLYAIKNALSVQKTFEDVLIENMPSELKPIWEKLNENYKKSIINSAKLYPDLTTPSRMEKFWESRRLESYTKINESKQILNENRVVDNTSLSDEQIDAFISKIKNLGY